MTGHVDSDALRSLVERLSTLTRESGSDDERRAAELIAAELIAAGAKRVRLEDERVHGTYWWPVGLPAAAAAVAGALAGAVSPCSPARSARPRSPATSASALGRCAASFRSARRSTWSARSAPPRAAHRRAH